MKSMDHERIFLLFFMDFILTVLEWFEYGTEAIILRSFLSREIQQKVADEINCSCFPQSPPKKKK